MQSLLNINVQILAEVRDGSLVYLDETLEIERQVGKKLDWEEVENTRQTAGSYFQTLYVATIPYHLAVKINPDLLGCW